jgi:amino acid transporter
MLAPDRLGVWTVFFFIVAAATPLTVLSGVVPAGLAITGVTGMPLVLLGVGAVLLLFAVGYAAMSHHVGNTGAFYAYIAKVGRPFGVGAGGIAVLAYNALQVGLYGLFGAVAAPQLATVIGFEFPWWALALAAWAFVAVLGVARVDNNGKVIAMLLTTEIAVVVGYDIAFLLDPAGGVVSYASVSPGLLTVDSVGVLAPLAMLAFIGVELSVVYAEEAKDPRRTVPRATLMSVAFFAVLYAVSVFAMTVTVGDTTVVAAARENPSEVLFLTAARTAGPIAADVGHVMLLTALLAAMLSFHGVCARYFYALGREGVLPAGLAAVARSGAPKGGSLLQSGIGLVVIVAVAATGADPVLDLFYVAGTGGGIGVMILLAATALSTVIYFTGRHRTEWNMWTRLVAPALAFTGLTTVLGLAAWKLNDLYGLPAGHPLPWAILALYGLVGIAGVGYGIWLGNNRPGVYARIGQGAHAATALLTGPRHSVTTGGVR